MFHQTIYLGIGKYLTFCGFLWQCQLLERSVESNRKIRNSLNAKITTSGSISIQLRFSHHLDSKLIQTQTIWLRSKLQVQIVFYLSRILFHLYLYPFRGYFATELFSHNMCHQTALLSQWPAFAPLTEILCGFFWMKVDLCGPFSILTRCNLVKTFPERLDFYVVVLEKVTLIQQMYWVLFVGVSYQNCISQCFVLSIFSIHIWSFNQKIEFSEKILSSKKLNHTHQDSG